MSSTPTGKSRLTREYTRESLVKLSPVQLSTAQPLKGGSSIAYLNDVATDNSCDAYKEWIGATTTTADEYAKVSNGE